MGKVGEANQTPVIRRRFSSFWEAVPTVLPHHHPYLSRLNPKRSADRIPHQVKEVVLYLQTLREESLGKPDFYHSTLNTPSKHTHLSHEDQLLHKQTISTISLKNKHRRKRDDLKTSNGIVVTGTLFLKGTSKGADGTRRRPLFSSEQQFRGYRMYRKKGVIRSDTTSKNWIGLLSFCTFAHVTFTKIEEETTLSLPSATKGFLAAGVKEQFSAFTFRQDLLVLYYRVAFRLVTYAQARAYHRSMVSDTERSNGGSDTIVSDRGMNPWLISPPPDIGILLQRSRDSGIALRDS
ncbi:hypothetical protein CDAR_477201 [Caerostris darwini]|uniref:Uncharacterized protein n=1 Tax=Caerostris darwini TaxID=1538125 RepID=A0AAV4TXP6_9ARAC|nr:hypothetical protein CDAR_477201 [Caerostris darwini]